jgi:small-conductance mechanosensitive channel
MMADLIARLRDFGVAPQQVAISLIILVAGGSVARLLTRLLHRMFQQLRRQLPVSLETEVVIDRVGRVFVWVVTFAVLFDYWGLSLSGLWTAVAGVAAAFGVGLLAIWAPASNITASLFIAIWKPYRLGEHVEILPEGLKGRAISRNLMVTLVREEDGAILAVPNNLILQRIVRVRPSAQAKSGTDERSPHLRAEGDHTVPSRLAT